MFDSIFKSELASIDRHYESLVEEHGINFRAGGWSSELSQTSRFDAIVRHLTLSNKRVLDVGCGVADFFSYCQRKSIEINYSGIDVCYRSISIARQRYPLNSFYYGDFTSLNWQHEFRSHSFDVVISSGLVADYPVSGQEFLRLLIKTMIATSREVVAFNCLAESENGDSRHFGLNSDQIAPIIQEYSRSYIIDNSYNPYDATYILFKKTADT